MSILVTGGGGYLGTHIVLELLKENKDIVVIDNFLNSYKSIIDNIILNNEGVKLYNFNLKDRKRLREVFKEEKITDVIHLAGDKSVPESIENPLTYYSNNLESSLSLLTVMKEFNIKRIIFSSTAAVYSEKNKYPINEKGKLGPSNPYSYSKLVLERMLFDLYNSDNSWDIMILRYFNPVGANWRKSIGEMPKSSVNNLMPYIIDVANKKDKYLNIFGNDYDTHDGTGVRDYIHVLDLAKAHIVALKNNIGINIYNIGTGKGYSVLDLVKTFELVNDVEIPYKIVDRRKGDIGISYADSTKAFNELDWKPEKTLEDMCRDAWNWETKIKSILKR